jgi:hypothetical protein
MKVCSLFGSIFPAFDRDWLMPCRIALMIGIVAVFAELVVAFFPEVRHCLVLACVWFEDPAD